MRLDNLIKQAAMFAFWLICSLFLVLLMTHLVSCDPNDLDTCWRVEDGVTIQPGPVPRSMGEDGPSLRDEGLDGIVEETVAWWNDQVGVDVLWYDPVTADITVEVNLVEPHTTDGWTLVEDYDSVEVFFSRYDGAMSTCHITLNADFAYHRQTMTQALRHAVGHCFGLEDDPGIDVTVDLRSIMSSPLDPLGELTTGDRRCMLDSMGVTP